ncbi:MAG: TMEM175 family protein [Gillisia sp.]
MKKNRLEAFSDGVLAIIITIMVLEIKVPEGDHFFSLQQLIPVAVSYVLSFLYIAIYWNNHHHMMHTVKYVNGKILWANMHLLFWLSLVPFATGWMGENKFAAGPMLLYGIILLMAAIAYYLLQSVILKSQKPNSLLKKAIGRDLKGKFSPVFYSIGIIFCYINVWIAGAIYVMVAFLWLIPDKRIEIIINQEV